MLNQVLNRLKAIQGKQIGIELFNGNKIIGTLLMVDEETLRVGTDKGITMLLVDSIQAIWEKPKSSLTEMGRAKTVKK